MKQTQTTSNKKLIQQSNFERAGIQKKLFKWALNLAFFVDLRISGRYALL